MGSGGARDGCAERGGLGIGLGAKKDNCKVLAWCALLLLVGATVRIVGAPVSGVSTGVGGNGDAVLGG